MSYTLAHYDEITQIPMIVDSFLNEEPVINFEAIGIIENLRANPQAYEGVLECVVVSKQDKIIAITCRIQPFNLLISHSSDINAISTIVDHYVTTKIDVPGLYGPLDETNSFVKRWTKLIDQVFQTEDEYLQYSLTKLRTIPEYVGDISIASEAQEELLSDWTVSSIREIIPTTTEKFEQGCVTSFKRLLEKRNVFVLDIDGTIVSMAAISGRTHKMQSIIDVYTPPEYRGLGHATELCTFLADYILNDCKNLPILWVKATNEAAIHIYEKIGFEQVAKMALCLK
ncbi:MAG: GNAT family N-acetyltransferase [Candidatus Heimdallarchaeaceae archaeon]